MAVVDNIRARFPFAFLRTIAGNLLYPTGLWQGQVESVGDLTGGQVNLSVIPPAGAQKFVWTLAYAMARHDGATGLASTPMRLTISIPEQSQWGESEVSRRIITAGGATSQGSGQYSITASPDGGGGAGTGSTGSVTGIHISIPKLLWRADRDTDWEIQWQFDSNVNLRVYGAFFWGWAWEANLIRQGYIPVIPW